jgi:hypothetical protein
MLRLAVLLAFGGVTFVQAFPFDERLVSIPMPIATVAAATQLEVVRDANIPVNPSSDALALAAGGAPTATAKQEIASQEERDSDRNEEQDGHSEGYREGGLTDSVEFSSTRLSSEVTAALGSMHAAFKLGSVLNATSTIESTYSNWVGPGPDRPISSACWRKTHIAKTCPTGFDRKLGVCWTECPYAYPVECGMECVRQNDDCGLAVFGKVAVVVQSALGLASWNLYGDMKKWAKGIQFAVKCSKYMISITKALVKYIRYIKVHDPQTSQDQLLAILYQIDNVVIDIPTTIAYCMGSKVSDDVKFADMVLTTAEYALREIIYYGDEIVSSWDRFAAFMKNITLGASISSLKEADISSLKTALESNSTCGFDMKRLLDRAWMTVAELRRDNPDMSEDDIRLVMSHSNLVLSDIPTSTNNCMGELIAESDEAAAYETRDFLRKTFGVIIDDLISSGTSDNGTNLGAKEFAFKVADRAVAFYAIWDWWYVSSVVSEFFQPICGPTELIGEIDDGSAKKALGLSIVQKAFNNSDGTWTRVGDGTVKITFQSVDTKDVTVNIKSGGDKMDEVDVPAGQTVTWTSDVKTLGGKTLYLDRWRPGFLGLPGTGGGSLLLWVPRSSQGGSLELTAMLNVS